jgi:4-diphosphocytidyl-2-C-methyl-D-erythritol kinase
MNRVARAKINLSLRILGKRGDGFHEIDTLIAPIALADELEFTDAPAFAFSCSDASLPTDDSNLAVRAARLFAERTGQPTNVQIHLEKRIPHGAGLGGGSSDAAAVLRALNERANDVLSLADLTALAAQLGSDVPFFLHDSAARCRGRGEIVEPCPLEVAYRLLLIKPPFPVPTPWAYRRWLDSKELPEVSYAPQRLAWGDLENDLERPVFEKYLFLAALKSWLAAQTEVAGALMSGSGSTSFAVVHGSASINELERRARAEFGDELWYCQTEMCG